jgi:ATP-dependent exoDNAse (exonuclease V) alpha subunit
VTTALHESDEQDFVRLAKDAASDRSAAIPTALLKRKIDGSGLDFTDAHGQSQRDAIERIGTGGRFGVILAAAGAGKTAALQPLTASWTEMGRDVYGASLAWRQADDLVEAGIDKRNVFAVSVMLDRFGFGLPDGEGPPPLTLTKNSVVAVDEWGLLGTRQGLELLRWQQRMGFSIVAFGDEKQCQSIQAGAIIDLTRKALGAGQIPEILTTKRQATDREK